MKAIRIVGFVALVNALIVGAGILANEPKVFLAYALLNGAVALVTQVFAFAGTLDGD